MKSDLSTMDLLSDTPIKVNQNCIIDLTRNGYKNIKIEEKRKCKILKFSSEWKFCEVLKTIAALNLDEYPNLFIFVIQTSDINIYHVEEEATTSRRSIQKENVNLIDELKTILLNFGTSRPLILQLTSEDENMSKIYYKLENSNIFYPIDAKHSNIDQIIDFPTFLCSFLNGDFENFLSKVLKILPQVQNSSLILRFLRIFDLTEEVLVKLILEVARFGTKTDLLAVLDGSFEDDGRTLSIEAQNWLAIVFYEEQASTESSENPEEGNVEKDIVNNDKQSISKQEQQETSNIEGDPDNEIFSKSSNRSVLLTAIENQNTEVIDYLITYWTFLIQELPFEHQVRISTAAFKTNQFEVLCDLLEYADYPFSEEFKLESIKHERITQIFSERTKFKAAIEAENYAIIDKFLNENLNLKLIYSPNNNSALTEAIILKKFGVFYYLKSLGYEGENCQNILKFLSKEEKEQAVKQAKNQRKANVNKSLKNVHKSILILSTKSLIHNRRTTTEQEAEFRKKIMKWYEDIFKIAPEMLNVVASCEQLKIIFDFESYSVENASLAGPNALGSMYPTSKWIFIGAQLFDNKREQQIKGVLAHELCHYAMRLVYENQENPYYKNRADMKEMFEEISKAIDKWSSDESECPDDECLGIISTVFRLYCKEEFHLELIVRVVQILIQFDDDESESRYLKENLKILFDFWYDHVVPEMQLYLYKNKDVIKLNKIIELLPKISCSEYKFATQKDLKDVLDSKLAIVTTNVPNLLFINIHKALQEKYGILLDSQNFFASPDKLNNQEIWNDFRQICIQSTELNIFIDCTKGVPDYLGGIFMNKELNYIIVVSNKSQFKDVTNILDGDQMDSGVKIDISYSWTDLTADSQELLLQTKINFQVNSEITLLDMFNKAEDPVTGKSAEKIVDDQLLNLMFENEQILINQRGAIDQAEGHFEFLIQLRTFTKKKKDQVSEIDTNRVTIEVKITQEQLLHDNKNKKFVLISDKAGNGKSWAVKNLSKILSNQNPTSWVTYVDLKQFIDEFKAHKGELEFSTFIVEKILKPKHKFEASIFQKLYNAGRVFILFDGFDEIAPTCAEFVSKLAKSFELNGGNQLWIATRDYFEVDLTQKLQLDVVYGLSDFSEDDGVDLIARSWVLSDKTEVKSRCELENSQNFRNYKQNARRLVKKVAMDRNRSIGMPQLYKMIADGFKDSDDVSNLEELKIYAKFVQNLYKRWSDEKGQLRKEASIQIQEYGLNFWKLHQYIAIANLFPNHVKKLFPDFNVSQWSDEEIVACGLMSKIGKTIFFLHESFREYFVADFIAKALKSIKLVKKSLISQIFERKGNKDSVIEMFIDILTIKNYNVIRMFLNGAIDHETLEKIKPEVKKFIRNFYEIQHFLELEKNSENIADFVLDILKTGEYRKVHSIINKSFTRLIYWSRSPKIFLKYLNFTCEYLNAKDLKQTLVEGPFCFFNLILTFSLGIEIFEESITKIELKVGKTFIQNELRTKIAFIFRWQKWENSFFFRHTTLDASKLQKCLVTLHKYLTNYELLEFLTISNDHNENILMFCLQIGNEDYLRILWTEIKNLSTSQYFKKFVNQQSCFESDILQSTLVFGDNVKIYKTLWELLYETFEDRKELSDMILQKTKFGYNFIHKFVQNYDDLETIEWTFDKLKENFSDLQFQELIKSRTSTNANLLQCTAIESKSPEIHKLIWKIYQNLCSSEQEFIETLKEVDNDGASILNYTARESSIEVLNFILEELEEKLSTDEFRIFLSNSNAKSPSLLHSAALNEISDVFKTIWRLFQKYFEPTMILEFAKHVSVSGNGFFHYIYSDETLEFATEELEKIASRAEIRRMLSILNKENQNILQMRKKSLKFHEILWTTLEKYFSKSEILNFIRNVDNDQNNVLLDIICGWFTKHKVIEMRWNEINSFMNHEKQTENLKIKSKDDKSFAEFFAKYQQYRHESFAWIRNILCEYGLDDQLDNITLYGQSESTLQAHSDTGHQSCPDLTPNLQSCAGKMLKTSRTYKSMPALR